LELVFPLEGVEAGTVPLARTLEIELGEPPVGRAVADTEARTLRGRLALLGGRAVLEVDLALAVGDAGEEYIIVRVGERASGGEREWSHDVSAKFQGAAFFVAGSVSATRTLPAPITISGDARS